MIEAVLGLGSNLGESEKTIEGAIHALGLLPRTEVQQVSSFYRTAPFGENTEGDPDFVNCCVKIQTELSPETLLGACLGIEAGFGRRRTYKNAPRIIDIDLLLYGDKTVHTIDLEVPHPRIRERGFVMVPLLDLYPQGKAMNYPFQKDLDALDCSDVRFLKEFLPSAESR